VDPWECKNSTHFAMLINVVPPSTNYACGSTHSFIRAPSGIGNLISWLDCCIAHDLRYSDCWMFGMGLAQYKANVDNELYNCMKSKCSAFWWSWGMNKLCEDYASSYWAAVNSSRGDEAFRISLNESCACAPCGPPRASGGNPSQVLQICRAWGGWSDPTQVGPPWNPPIPSFPPLD